MTIIEGHHNLKTSALGNHFDEEHGGERPSEREYTIKVTGSYRTALDRQISEAVKIKNTNISTLINKRNEWRHNKQTTLRATTL